MSDSENSTEESQAMTQEIIAKHDPNVDTKEVTFSFRKTTDDSGAEYKRDPVIVNLRVPSVEGVVAILEKGGSELELLMSAVQQIVTDYGRQLVNDDSKLISENFPVSECTWEKIANLPDTDKRGRGIPKETWEDFFKSYLDQMPAITGKSQDIIKRQVAVMAQKFQPLKAHEQKAQILPNFITMLSMYTNNIADADQYTACVEFLVKKAEQYLNQDNSADLASNLGF